MQNAQRQSGSTRRLRQTFAVICVLAGLIPAPASALAVEEITSEKGIKAWLVEEHSQFENAKRFLIGLFLLDFDTNAKVANFLLGFWIRGEKPTYPLTRNQRISAVTLGDVKRVADEVLKADRLVVTIVGMPKLAQ
jgi:predicted Zn-dependent peptidase